MSSELGAGSGARTRVALIWRARLLVMPETLVDAQAAAEKRVHALAGSLRAALAPIQEQLDNPVPGAHCSCLKPRMFNEFRDTWTVQSCSQKVHHSCEKGVIII